MPANTSNGWPYVLPADNVADYPVTSQALAAFADAHVPYAWCNGTFAMSVGTSSSYDRVVTFPVGLFSLAPMVLCGKAGGVNVIKWGVAPVLQTKDGFTLRALTNDGSTGGSAQTLTAYWFAIQYSAAAVYTPGTTLLDQVIDLTQEDDPDAVRAILAAIAEAEAAETLVT